MFTRARLRAATPTTTELVFTISVVTFRVQIRVSTSVIPGRRVFIVTNTSFTQVSSRQDSICPTLTRVVETRAVLTVAIAFIVTVKVSVAEDRVTIGLSPISIYILAAMIIVPCRTASGRGFLTVLLSYRRSGNRVYPSTGLVTRLTLTSATKSGLIPVARV